MRLDQLLLKNGLCESRTEAQDIILSGFVTVDGIIITKQSKKMTGNESVTISQRRNFVSRGGSKLEGALYHVFVQKDEILAFMEGKAALDVGSSTGGFTDCLLQYGVSHITSVDVGTLQLHTSIRNNPRVSLFENCDIRDFKCDKKFDVIVADLSFIQLEKILRILKSLGAAQCHYFLLLKPQFEVGKGNTKKGIVKDASIVQEVITRYQSMCENELLSHIEIFPCSIQGGDGNQEYFIYAKSKHATSQL